MSEETEGFVGDTTVTTTDAFVEEANAIVRALSDPLGCPLPFLLRLAKLVQSIAQDNLDRKLRG